MSSTAAGNQEAYLFWWLIIPLNVVWLGLEFASRLAASPSLLVPCLLACSTVGLGFHHVTSLNTSKVPQVGRVFKRKSRTINNKEILATEGVTNHKPREFRRSFVAAAAESPSLDDTAESLKQPITNHKPRVFKRSASVTSKPVPIEPISIVNSKTGEFEHSFIIESPKQAIVEPTCTINRKTGEFEYINKEPPPDDHLPFVPSYSTNRKTGEFEYVNNRSHQSQPDNIPSSPTMDRRNGELMHLNPIPSSLPHSILIPSINRKTGEFEYINNNPLQQFPTPDSIPIIVNRKTGEFEYSPIKRRFSFSRRDSSDDSTTSTATTIAKSMISKKLNLLSKKIGLTKKLNNS